MARLGIHPGKTTPGPGSTMLRGGLALLALAYLSLLAPALKLATYNVDYFGFTLPELLLAVLPLAMLLSLPGVFAQAFPPLRQPLLALMGLLLAASVASTFLLPVYLEPLEGGNGWLFQVRKEVRMVTLVVVVAWCGLLWRGRGAAGDSIRPLLRASTVICVVYVLLFCGYSVVSGQLPFRAVDGPQRDNDWRLVSRSRNIFILSFDQVQGSIIRGHLADRPDVVGGLDGFVFYPEAASTYPNTEYSLASTLLGRLPVNAAERAMEVSAGEGSILTLARRAGYEVFATPVLSAGGFACVLCPETHRRIREGRERELLRHAVNLAFGVDMAGLPLLDRIVVVAGRPADGLAWKMDFDRLAEQLAGVRAARDRPVLQFMHFYGSHQPFNYDGQCRRVDQRKMPSCQGLDGARGAADCMFRIVAAFLDQLRRDGIYDDSMIFLV